MKLLSVNAQLIMKSSKSNLVLYILALSVINLSFLIESTYAFNHKQHKYSSLSNSKLKKTTIDYYTEYVFNFTVPKNNPEIACLKMDTSILFLATYQLKSENGSIINSTVNFTLPSNNFTYDGFCLTDKISLEINFLNDWRLELYFDLVNETYQFYHVVLYYDFNGPLFPNSIDQGGRSEVYDTVIANSTLNTSITCESGYRINLDDVVVYLSDVRLEPFFNKRPNLPFDKEIRCPNDQPSPIINNSSILIPIIVFSGFLSLIIISCILYVWVKARSKRTYDTVNTETS